MEYLSISSILKNGPSKYARSYLYTESDGYDATYFVDFNLRVIIRAIERLRDYLSRKASEVQRVEGLIGNSMLARHMNHRQLAIISHILRSPGESYTIESHKKSHSIAYPTARKDLLWLEENGLLVRKKIGRSFVFEGAPDIDAEIERLKKKFE